MIFTKSYIIDVERDPKLREKCLYPAFFWFVFSRIRTKYGEIRSICPYSVQMRRNTDQKTPSIGAFQAVLIMSHV